MNGNAPAPRCVHCGVEVFHGSTPGSGWSHINNLQRCKSPDVPYYHLAHPDLPCPADGPNPCIGSLEEGGCAHIALSASALPEEKTP